MPKDTAMTPAALGEITERLFPEAARLRRELADKLAELEQGATSNHLQSPARSLALHVSSLVQGGQTDIEGISDLIKLLTANAFTYRARKLRDYVGECSAAENETLLGALFEAKTRDAKGKPVAFEDDPDGKTYHARIEDVVIEHIVETGAGRDSARGAVRIARIRATKWSA